MSKKPNEYQRVFNKRWEHSLTKKEGNYKARLFDMYEMYPMLFSVLPLSYRLEARVSTFENNCRDEISDTQSISHGMAYKKTEFDHIEHEDFYILSCYFKGCLYKRVKLLKSDNKVDHSYEGGVYTISHESYTENLAECYQEALEAISAM